MATVSEVFEKAAQFYDFGDHSQAEHFALLVLRAEPNHDRALHMLGLIALHKGHLKAAIEYMKRSLLANKTNAVIWKHLADTHFLAGNVREAVACYEQAIMHRPDFIEAYNDLGVAWQHLGDFPRAEVCHKKAIHFMPNYAPAYNNLGSALKNQEKLTEALAAFEQAVKLQPENSEFVHNLADAYHEAEEMDRAILYYRQALALRPNYAAASNNLGVAFKEQGLLEESIAQFRETLKLQPDHALAYFNLSAYVGEGRYDFTQEEFGRIKGFLESGHGTEMDRSLYGFAQATVLAKQEKYDEAFAIYQQANDLRKRYYQDRQLFFDPLRHEKLIDRMISTYDEAYFERVRGWGTDTEVPIFIIGMPRSGSTLVEQILASHPQVFGAGELCGFHQFISKSALEPHVSLYPSPRLPTRMEADQWGADYLHHLANLGKGVARVTIKTLQNFMNLGLIATLFPRARILHCRRDPIDVCLSCYFTSFKISDYAWSLEDIGVYYRTYEKLMSHWSRVLPMPIHEVRYEELIDNQEAVTRGLLTHCDLVWDERCLDFFKTRRVVRTASTVQVRKPINKQAVGRWKHYREHLGPLFKALGLKDSGAM